MSSSSSSCSKDIKKTRKKQDSRRQFTSLNPDASCQLCFLRHGQSTWNRDNLFIGWTDTPLTEQGIDEARAAGRMLSQSGMLFDEVHTSPLRRTIRTANLSLMELQQEYVPVFKSWRLNERNYGNLVGKNKKEAVREHGADQVHKSESLHNTVERSSVYWRDVLAPSLRQGKTL